MRRWAGFGCRGWDVMQQRSSRGLIYDRATRSTDRLAQSHNPKQPTTPRNTQEIARNPYALKAWLRYLEAKTQACQARPVKRYLIYERALKFLPGSYKLWAAYLQERRAAVEGKVPVTHARYQILVNTYERCVRALRRVVVWWLGFQIYR